MYIKKRIKYILSCLLAIGIIQVYSYASYEDFLKQLQTMGIDVTGISDQEVISRYDVARLLNAVECQDCINPSNQMINRYVNNFWTEFIALPGKDFDEITYLGAPYQEESYYYCVAYVGDNNYMRGYPAGVSPICNGQFCGTRNTSMAEFLQVVINILSKYIYSNYTTNWEQIQQRTKGLEPGSYPDRYWDEQDDKNVVQALKQCDARNCQIIQPEFFKTYLKYCMFNIDTCQMRSFGKIGQAYWPVAELNILYNQDIIDLDTAGDTNIYEMVDGERVLQTLYKLYGKINCTFNNDYDCDGRENDKDSCPNQYNPNQVDTDKDKIGDVCDDDIDGDGIKNAVGIVDDLGRINIALRDKTTDNCLWTINPDQQKSEGNILGDRCINSQDKIAIYIATAKVQGSVPVTVDFTAITAGQIPQKITRQFGDGNTAEGNKVSHTFTSPGLYTIQAAAQGSNIIAYAETAVIIGNSIQGKKGIQINKKGIQKTGTNIGFNTDNIGSIDEIRWDFGNGNTIVKAVNQTAVTQYNTNGIYPITTTAYKNNVVVAVARIYIGVGDNTYGSSLETTNLNNTVNTPIGFTTSLEGITSADIKNIRRDFGDGIVIENTDTNTVHTYSIVGPRVIKQRITLLNNIQRENFITIYVEDPNLNKSFGINLTPNKLVSVNNSEINFTPAILGDAITNKPSIQMQRNDSETNIIETIDKIVHRYEIPGIVQTNYMVSINQCLYLHQQQTLIIQDTDLCMSYINNPKQAMCDSDKDKIPDSCDDDIDGDRVKNLIGIVQNTYPNCAITGTNINQDILYKHIQGVCTLDNCPWTANANQLDLDQNKKGDVCQTALDTIIENNSSIKQPENDKDKDGIRDAFDACPNIPENYNTIEDGDGCPEIGSELNCPSYVNTFTTDVQSNIPRCPLNTTLCGDNTCHETCENNGGLRPTNNNGICEPLESCTSADCTNGQQDRCQYGLICGINNNNNPVCIDNPVEDNPIEKVGEPGCQDPGNCITLPPIIASSCNQCPCPFVDFTNDLSSSDQVRATLRDSAKYTIFSISQSKTIEQSY